MSYLSNFFINLEQWEKRISDVAHFIGKKFREKIHPYPCLYPSSKNTDSGHTAITHSLPPPSIEYRTTNANLNVKVCVPRHKKGPVAKWCIDCKLNDFFGNGTCAKKKKIGTIILSLKILNLAVLGVRRFYQEKKGLRALWLKSPLVCMCAKNGDCCAVVKSANFAKMQVKIYKV